MTEILSHYNILDIFFINKAIETRYPQKIIFNTKFKKKTNFQLLLPLVFEIFENWRFWDFSCSMEGMRFVMAACLYLKVLKLQFLLKFVTFFRRLKLLHFCSYQRTRKKKSLFLNQFFGFYGS